MRSRLAVLAFAFILLLTAFVAAPAFAEWPVLGRAITTAPGDQLGPVSTSDGAGGAIFAWQDRRSFPFNIDVEHVLASGVVDAAWPVNGRALLSDALVATIVPQAKESPAIAADGAGGVIVTWPDARNNPNGLDVFAQHVLASGTVDPNWPANGMTVCSVVGDQVSPIILSDGAGGAFIAWTDGRSGTTVNDIDVFAQHVLASGVVDPAWPANGTPVSRAPKAQIGLGIVEDGLGGFFLSWQDLRSGNPGIDIFAHHVLRSGVTDPAWPVDGRALSAAPGTQTASRIVADGKHGALVTWRDDRDDSNDIYAQRVLISGAIAPGWAANGQPVATTAFSEDDPALSSDGAGGAIVVWGETSTGVHNMRAMHLLGSGGPDPSWPAGGVALSISDCEETTEVMASDGAGGAIVAWQRCFDIFAQHVLASGALDPTYPASGLTLSAIPGSLQHEPDIVATGDGGAIVSWMDTRDGPNDIYALQVLAAVTLDVPGEAPPGVTFARPRPNPASGAVSLRFSLPRVATVSLAIYDAGGRRVRTLGSGARAPGEHLISWDLRDEAGHAVSAGLYFARFETEGHVFGQKIMALR